MALEATVRPWMCRVSALVFAALMSLTPAAAAQAVDDVFTFSEEDLLSLDEDGWFSASEEQLFSFDEDALFGGGGLLSDVETPEEQSLEEVFLVRDRVDVGGSYRAALSARRAWSSEGEELFSDVSLNAGGTLYLDARPRRDVRAFVKLKGDGVWAEENADAEVMLHELFADFVLGERAFFRVGKQTVTWGVGYFFSPADVINVGRIDPEDPEAEREGPVAVRLHVPSGRSNWYGYVLVDGRPDHGWRVALAPKAEFVMGRSELGAGLYVRDDRAPRAMATLSTSAGPVSVFGELVVSRGSDKRFVRETTPTLLNSLGLEFFRDEETLFVHTTAGARYTYSDPDGRFTLTGAAQYYFNGEGYDRAFLEEHGWKLPLLVEAGELRAADVERPGRHYGALTVTGSHERLKNVGVAAFWLGNLSDGSAMVTVSADYGRWRHVRPSVSFSRAYGDPGSELAPAGAASMLTVSISVGGSF